jgi:YidC/Oxa1 family membrane protein insertase
MQRRLLLALTLGVGVILLTNVFFPPAPPPAVPEASAVAGAAGAAGTTAPASATTAAAPLTGAAVAPAGAEAASPPTAETMPFAPVETLTIASPKATFRFSTLGAAVLPATLPTYRSLRSKGDSTPVLVGRGEEALFSYALVVPGDTVAIDSWPFTAERTQDASGETLTFTATNGPVRVRIAYTVPTDTALAYRVRVAASIEGVAGNPYLLVRMPEGFQSQEANPEEDATHTAYVFKRRGGDASSIAFSSLDPEEQTLAPGPHTWVAAKSKYFVAAILAPTEQDELFAELSVTGGARTERYASNARATVVTATRAGNAAWELYIGPQEWRRLVAAGRDFDNVNPYGGWLQGVVQPFATIVMRILLWMRDTTALSYGWVLVIFGVAVRLVLWPLNQSAMRSSIRMQRIQPELQALQAKFKSDPQKLQAEMMKLYAAHGMSPFSAFSGCLPMLIPMPVLFALFFVFQNTIEFRGVPFLWLPDLSAKDPYFITPVAMAGTMLLMSWIGMRGAPPNPQAKLMMWLFPAMMLVFFWNFASGLNLYYTVQNIAALPQQWLIANERLKAAPGKAG